MLVKSGLVFLASVGIAAAQVASPQHITSCQEIDANTGKAVFNKDCCTTDPAYGGVCTVNCENGSAECAALCKLPESLQSRATCNNIPADPTGSGDFLCYPPPYPVFPLKFTGASGQCCVCTYKPGDDPWITGFHGQRFLFEGTDGKWYNLIHDPIRDMTINVLIYEVKEDVKADAPTTFFDGVAFTLKGEEGEEHRILVKAKDTKNFKPKCEDGKTCIANGALHLEIDGVEVTEPSFHDLGDNLAFGIYNAPWECKAKPASHGEWDQVEAAMKEKKNRGRRLVAIYEPEIEILRNIALNNVFDEEKCREWFRARHMDRDVFKQEGKHATAFIFAQDFHLGLEFTINEDPKWVNHQRFDLSFVGYQPAKDASGKRIASGIMGETAQLKYDAVLHTAIVDGRDDILSGPDEDYEVSGPFSSEFVARSRSEAHLRI